QKIPKAAATTTTAAAGTLGQYRFIPQPCPPRRPKASPIPPPRESEQIRPIRRICRICRICRRRACDPGGWRDRGGAKNSLVAGRGTLEDRAAGLCGREFFRCDPEPVTLYQQIRCLQKVNT